MNDMVTVVPFEQLRTGFGGSKSTCSPHTPTIHSEETDAQIYLRPRCGYHFLEAFGPS
jgi:hypothetical protein